MKPVDCLIPAAPKDYSKLPYVVGGVREHVPEVETVHIVSPSPTGFEAEGVISHRDHEVLPYDRDELPYRPNWTMQQMIKLFQDVTEHDWYLVVDADIVIDKRLPMWNEDGDPILYLARDQNHGAYFEFNQRVLGFGRVYDHSFLSECTFYNKGLVREMLDYAGLDLDGFWELLKETGVGFHPAESELYGSYVYHEHPDLYDIRQIKSRLGGKYNCHIWGDKEIRRYLEDARESDPDAYLISIHSWEGRIK